jgi:hypothetical protein
VGTAQTSAEPALQIACDESGWEGTNLATANSDVIAYASVRLPIDGAAEAIRALRGPPRQHSYEFKASHLIRANGGAGLVGFLASSGPVYGRARVHLTHKSCFILGRILDLFLGAAVDAATLGLVPDQRIASLATRLCRAGPDAFGPQPWRAFLAAANVLLRADRRRLVREPVDAFFDQVAVLRGMDRVPVTSILDELGDRRPEAYAARARLLDDQMLHPVLEPLIPALARTVLHWSRGVHPIAVIHDEQSALTERRMRRLEQVLAAPPLELIRLPAHGRFLQFRQVDSRIDPRVQVADLLAGVARKLASENLLGRSDPDLTALLRPYLDPDSRWCERPLLGLSDQSGHVRRG